MKDQKLEKMKTALYGIKTLIMPIYLPYRNWRRKRKNENFLNNGLEALQRFDECLTEKGVNYMLGFGTLLGAIREHGFIKHDFDIDTCMWYDEYVGKNVRSILERNGFNCAFSFLVDEGQSGMEVTFYFKGVRIDIFIIYPPVDKLPYTCNLWRPYGNANTRYESMKKYGKLVPYRLELPYSRKTIRVDFLSLKLPVPVNYESILSKRYGSSYMIPDPNWIEPIDTFVCWDTKKAVLVEYK